MSKQSNDKVATSIPETPRVASTKISSAPKGNLLFGEQNYKVFLIGLGLVVLGFVLMSGGAMPDENTWDTGIIYSFRRITLAPMVILAGLGTVAYSIFVSPKNN